jgi:hypothetical protein
MCFPLQEKHFKWDKNGHEFEVAKNVLKTLPSSSIFYMPYDSMELHSLSDSYLVTLQTVLEKLSHHLESQHST